MQTVAKVLTALVGGLWTLFVWIGVDLIDKHAPMSGFPNIGQIEYYIVIPVTMALVLLWISLIFSFF
jgi:hypothetical protein